VAFRHFFSRSTSVLLCHHSCNGPQSPSSTYCYYQKDKDAKPGKLFKKQYSFGNREALDIQYFRLAIELGCTMDQAAGHRPIILKASVRCPVSPWEIWGGQSVIGKEFSPKYFGSSPFSIIVSIPHKKVKQSHYRPGQAQRVLRKLRFPDFATTAQDFGRLLALRTGRLYPQEILLILIYVRG